MEFFGLKEAQVIKTINTFEGGTPMANRVSSKEINVKGKVVNIGVVGAEVSFLR